MNDDLRPFAFLPAGYLLTVLIELPVLMVGLQPCHSVKRRLLAGLWLTACTYPIVVLVLPEFFNPGPQRPAYLLVAETFAPAAECALFWLACVRDDPEAQPGLWRDMLTIVLANLLSFSVGEALIWLGLLG
jgi:hypothetical protein